MLKIAPAKLYINDGPKPMININNTDFNAATNIPLENPYIIKVTIITMFDRPNLAPGMVKGNGIILSISDTAKAIATSKPVYTKSLISLFIKK